MHKHTDMQPTIHYNDCNIRSPTQAFQNSQAPNTNSLQTILKGQYISKTARW